MTTLRLPKQKQGRRSERDIADWKAFADSLQEIGSTVDFKISARGWCYDLEGRGLVTKGQFDFVVHVINECRKIGLLPADFTAEDRARRWDWIDRDSGFESVEDYAAWKVDRLLHVHRYYPTPFWDSQDHYIQLLVEKVDLASLFKQICKRYHIPLSNSKGWWSINQRVFMLRRFKEMEAKGKQCVFLYCGDFDPVGVQISDTFRKHLKVLEDIEGWNPDNLIIDRFGLNYDFIEEQGLTWIDNLETGSGKSIKTNVEPGKSWVKKYGVRKVEANAIVARPDAGRKLCEDAIRKYLGDPMPAYEALESKNESALKDILTDADYYNAIEGVRQRLNE